MALRVARFEPPISDSLRAAVEGFDCVLTSDAGEGEVLVRDFLSTGRFAEAAANGTSTTYLAIDPTGDPRLVGYVTLAVTQVFLTGAERRQAEVEDRAVFGAVRAAMLGVDHRVQGQGVGGALLDSAIGHAADLSRSVATRFVVVDALPDRDGWYAQRGFRECRSERERERGERHGTTSMYLDLGPDPRQLLGPSAAVNLRRVAREAMTSVHATQRAAVAAARKRARRSGG